jgi:uncharacterized damage-inducible protein DinB
MARKVVRKSSRKPAKKRSRTAPRKPTQDTPEQPGGFTPPSAKQHFLDTLAREQATTLKVLRALPSGQSDFRPHPRSRSAADLAFTFVLEQLLITKALRNELTMGAGVPATPEDFNAIVAQFAYDFKAMVDLIRKTPEEELLTTTVKFPVGPGQMGDWPKLAFLWFMLMDQVHHRGQLSVYVRMAGGQVPSIYGPSGDETWR